VADILTALKGDGSFKAGRMSDISIDQLKKFATVKFINNLFIII